MTNNVTVLLVALFFTLLQAQHCVCDVVSADNRVPLKYASGPPSTDFHDHGFRDAGPPQVACSGSPALGPAASALYTAHAGKPGPLKHQRRHFGPR